MHFYEVKGDLMWEEPKTNDLPNVIDLRGLTADQLAENWVMLAGFGRKEILIRCGVRGNDHLDVCMHEHLAKLPGLLTDEELQAVVDILARHGEISGLWYASRFNTVDPAPRHSEETDDFYPSDLVS